MTFRLTLPLRIESVANKREHWAVTAKRTSTHRLAAISIQKHKVPPLPCTVTITRIAPKQLDSDNLQSGAKALRDGIADRLGVNDNDPRVTWVYAQERGEPREYAVRIEISESDPVSELRRAGM